MNPKQELYVDDIALLRVIQDHPASRVIDLWLPKGKGLWNDYLHSSGLIRLGRCTEVKSKRHFWQSICTLQFCGYLRTDCRHYTCSDVGMALFFTLSSHPKQWPLVVKLNEHGERLWETALYFERR